MITAKDNPRIKELKKLQQRKYRKKLQRYLIEGFHLVEEAHLAKAPLQEIFVTEKFLATAPLWLKDYPLVEVSEEILQHISELPTAPGILAVCKIVKPPVPETLSGGYLLIDRIQDPGNLGTMIRTADAFHLTGVVLGSGTVDVYQGKVLRALQGSQYHLPIFEGDLKIWLAKAAVQKIPSYGTELNEQARPLKEIKAPKDFLVILGNEGQGVAKELLEETTENIYIEMPGAAESLNVGVACGILLYHLTQS